MMAPPPPPSDDGWSACPKARAGESPAPSEVVAMLLLLSGLKGAESETNQGWAMVVGGATASLPLGWGDEEEAWSKEEEGAWSKEEEGVW